MFLNIGNKKNKIWEIFFREDIFVLWYKYKDIWNIEILKKYRWNWYWFKLYSHAKNLMLKQGVYKWIYSLNETLLNPKEIIPIHQKLWKVIEFPLYSLIEF